MSAAAESWRAAVRVSSRAPPLRLAISREVVGPALAVYALVLAAVVLAATRGAFRSARGPARLPDVGA